MAKEEAQSAVAVKEKFEVEFTPFGGNDNIKLNLAIIQKFVAIPTTSGALPNDRDCIRFMMLCRARKLNPFEGDCYLQGYDGKNGAQFSLITAHQAFLKRAELHPEFNGMESGVIVVDRNENFVEREGDFTFKDDTLLGAWAVVYFKTRAHPMKDKLRLETYSTGRSRWEKDPAGMITKCAEASALRKAFPTMLGGLYSAEEMGKTIEVEAHQPKAPIHATSLLPDRSKTQEAPNLSAASAPEASEAAAATKTPTTKKTAPKPASDEKADLMANYNELCVLLKRDNVSQDQLLQWLKEKKMTTDTTEELAGVAEKTLGNVIADWGNIMPLAAEIIM